MSFELQPELIGDTVRLRPLTAGDYDALYAAASDPLIWEQHPENRHEPDVFKKFFDGAIAMGALAIIDKNTDEIIGTSRFHGFDPEQGAIEIGWTFIARPYWGGACNKEVKTLMLRHAFKAADHVLFKIAPDNWRSRKAAEKLGAMLIGEEEKSAGRASLIYRLSVSGYSG